MMISDWDANDGRRANRPQPGAGRRHEPGFGAAQSRPDRDRARRTKIDGALDIRPEQFRWMAIQNDHDTVVFSLVEHLRSVDHALSRATASSLIDLNLHVPSRLGTTIAVVRPKLVFRISYPKHSRASIFGMEWRPALASLKWHEFAAVDVTAPIMSNSLKELLIR
jgi:hypothetical protein